MELPAVHSVNQIPAKDWDQFTSDLQVEQDGETYKVRTGNKDYKIKVHLPGRYAAAWQKAPEEKRFSIVKKVFIASVMMLGQDSNIEDSHVTATFHSASRVSIKAVPLGDGQEVVVPKICQGPFFHAVTGEFYDLGIRVPLPRGAIGSFQSPGRSCMGYGGNAAALAIFHSITLPQAPVDDEEEEAHITHLRDIGNTWNAGRKVKSGKIQDFLESVDAKKDKGRINKEVPQQDPLEIIRKFHEKFGGDTEIKEYELRGEGNKFFSATRFKREMRKIPTRKSTLVFLTPRHKSTASLTGSKSYPKNLQIQQSVRIGTVKGHGQNRHLTSAIAHQKKGRKDVYVTYIRWNEPIGNDLDDKPVYAWFRVQDELVEEVLWDEVENDLKKNGTLFNYTTVV